MTAIVSQKSPSARKVWIEIVVIQCAINPVKRHLPQGRCGLKSAILNTMYEEYSHLPQGRCGLKLFTAVNKIKKEGSPSARKVWIEITARGSIEVENKVTFRKEGVD